MQRSAMPTVQENRFLTKKLVYSHAGLLWHVQQWAGQQDRREATLHAILSLISNRHLIKLENIDHDIPRQVGEDSFQPCTAFMKLTDLHWKFFQLNVFCSSAFNLQSPFLVPQHELQVHSLLWYITIKDCQLVSLIVFIKSQRLQNTFKIMKSNH